MKRNLGHRLLLAVVATFAIAPTGCQVYVGGQTLPSAWYYKDDVQYHPAGPEFKLYREAAELERRKQEARREAGEEAQRTPPGAFGGY